MAGLKDILASVGIHYDRVITGAVLIFLVGSLLYLAVQVGLIRSMQGNFQREIDAMRPRHAEAQVENEAPFREALVENKEPFSIPGWQSAMFVPELRVWCVDCRRPIPYVSTNCAFCTTPQPQDPEDRPGRDLDRDLMKDVWEEAHGLDPRDPSDAARDNDGDGYLNLEEHDADPQTDPTDAKSHPPYAGRVHLVNVKANPFKLRFKSRMGAKYALNLRGGAKTYFVKQGETVEGFTVAEFEEKEEEREIPGFSRPRMVDVSVLTLKRGDRTIPLVIKEDVQYNEYVANLVFALDNEEISATINGKVILRGEGYTLTGIDSKQGTVTLVRNRDGARFVVGKRAR